MPAPPAKPVKKPFILGLTGSIGMGKSAVAAMLTDLGVPVFDADATVHRLQGPGGALLGAIEAAFPGTTGPDGVRRAELGAQVFGDAAALKRLEAIVHPAVAAMRAAFLAEHGEAPLVVFDIPLLYEKGGAQALDAVAVVSAPGEMQRERVLARPGMTPEKFAQIVALQVPDAQKRARADFVIDTGMTLEATRAAVERLVVTLRQKNAGPALASPPLRVDRDSNA
ncbi:dephospho-CoA kinase [Novosphingobium lentum]|uniref:dephospho-CoA kinase n=1 Tax=Novosphingobium lentum TaxID=145287 RepID=UPI00082D95D5|nr:dephospho-CoA kinase [Novosphingobium lentum]